MSPGGKDQLHGWKEIAAYLGRDERTAKRWEKLRGLPVRRIPGSGRANVYVIVSELNAWFAPVAELGQTEGAGNHPAPLVVSLPEASPASGAIVHSQPDLSLPSFLASLWRGYLRIWLLGVGVASMIVGGYLTVQATRRHAAPQNDTLEARKVTPEQPDEQYLQAVYLLEQRTPDALEAALHTFSQTVARDPRNAQAYAKIAITYLLLREYSLTPQKEAYQQAKAAAERALTLDPNLPEAHAALGFIDFFSEWRPARAAERFHTAIRLDPTCVLAHHWYGSMLMHQAKFPAALQELALAQRYAPTSPAVLSSKALALGFAGHREEAVTMLRTLTRIDPNAAAPHRYLATLSLIEPRDVPQYIEEMRRFSVIRKDAQEQALMARAAQAYRRGGQRAVWQEMLAAARKDHPADGEPSFARAEAEALLGQRDRAIADLARLSERRDPEMIGVLIAATLAPLQDDPRLPGVIQQVGLLAQE